MIMNHAQLITLWIIAAVATFLAISDVVLYKRKGVDATYSRVLLKFSRQWLIVPIVVGVIVGHIFWPNCGDPPKKNKVECARAGD